jgi:general secretion pathway protein L
MPTLVIQLPERPRLAGSVPAAPTSSFDWLLLADDGTLLGEGQDLPAALPKSEQLVLLLPEHAVSWHRTTLPKGSVKRWRAALVGLLEEQVLEDADGLQFAIDEQLAGGESSWVAATPRAPLQEAMTRIESAQRTVDRILPRSWPSEVPQGHFFSDEAGVQLRWSDADGVTSLPLRGGFARARFSAGKVQSADWSASGPALEAAEHWLGTRVILSSAAEQAQRALASPWNLRQFELAPRLHGVRWLRQLMHQLMHRQWRAARWGLSSLLLLSLVGINGMAWQQRSQLAQRQLALETTLKTAFPRVTYVLEPATQMQRELNTLRAQAGELGEQDLETLIAALSVAWPESRGPVEALNFEPGQLSVSASGWSDEQVEQLRRQLASEGWQLVAEQGRLLLKKGKT